MHDFRTKTGKLSLNIYITPPYLDQVQAVNPMSVRLYCTVQIHIKNGWFGMLARLSVNYFVRYLDGICLILGLMYQLVIEV